MTEKKSLMRTLFRTEHNLKMLQRSGIEEKSLKLFKDLAAKKRARLRELGVPDDEYKEFVESYWLELEAELMEAEFQDSCLTLMRQQQSYQKKHLGDIPSFPCRHHERTSSCGPLCRHYKKATPEQEANFSHFCDIDTGKPYEVREFTDEEFGQNA